MSNEQGVPILCQKPLQNRSRYATIAVRRCHRIQGHAGPCDEFPYLQQFKREYPRVAGKIIRDATMTTGAAWKSEEAGPNRILRWVMQLNDEELRALNINMAILKPGVVAKLRQKAASYEDCMEVAMKLTWGAYQMWGAPMPPPDIQAYLESFFGAMHTGTTLCMVCRLPLSFASFQEAQRGKAEIETAHRNPRAHNAENVGFAHRECNIAQGNKTLEEFYNWIAGILSRVPRV